MNLVVHVRLVQDVFGAGVGDELDELDELELDDPDPPEDDDAALLDFSAGLAAGVESDLLSDFAALFSADSELDLLPDSARESLR
jgi:hypothetical protein